MKRIRAYDCSAAGLAVAFEELEKVVAHEDVEVDCDLVEQQDIVRGHETKD